MPPIYISIAREVNGRCFSSMTEKYREAYPATYETSTRMWYQVVYAGAPTFHHLLHQYCLEIITHGRPQRGAVSGSVRKQLLRRQHRDYEPAGQMSSPTIGINWDYSLANSDNVSARDITSSVTQRTMSRSNPFLRPTVACRAPLPPWLLTRSFADVMPYGIPGGNSASYASRRTAPTAGCFTTSRVTTSTMPGRSLWQLRAADALWPVAHAQPFRG